MPDLPSIPWEVIGKSDRSLPMKRAGVVIDLRCCVGCHACSVSCKTENVIPLGNFRNRVRYLENP